MTDGNEKQPLSARINASLSRHRTAIIVVAAALLLLIAGSVVAFTVSQRRLERATATAEQVEALFLDWQAAVDADEAGADGTEALETSLRDAIADITDEFPRSYAAARAQFILASVEWQLDAFQAAHDAYLAVADREPDSYLAPIALFNAAAALEETGDSGGAADLYQRVVDSAVPNVEAPRALFAPGRIAEGENDTELALGYYNRLIDEHGGSNWTNLGRNRIIWLNSQGGQ